MSSPDPSMWEEVAKYLWSVLTIPVAMLWRKADGAVQKPDFEKHKENVREDIRLLYQNAEADRKLVRDGFDEITKTIHQVHVDLLEKMK